jgi:hypothetical protein
MVTGSNAVVASSDIILVIHDTLRRALGGLQVHSSLLNVVLHD